MNNYVIRKQFSCRHKLNDVRASSILLRLANFCNSTIIRSRICKIRRPLSLSYQSSVRAGDSNKGLQPQNANYIACANPESGRTRYKYDCVRWRVRICCEPTQMQTLRNFRSVIVLSNSNLITMGGYVTRKKNAMSTYDTASNGTEVWSFVLDAISCSKFQPVIFFKLKHAFCNYIC